VCALYKGEVELPSDLQGIVYVPVDPAEGWKLKLGAELKHAGLNVDLNRVI
jgi:predicted nucleotide-binding protein